jgi:hypothetical protein
MEHKATRPCKPWRACGSTASAFQHELNDEAPPMGIGGASSKRCQMSQISLCDVTTRDTSPYPTASSALSQ